MSFQVPRRDHFPRPPGDNSPFTPPDPEPQWPPYRPPSAEDYRLARQRWEQTGEITALWEMLDNVAARPWPSPKPSPGATLVQVPVPPARPARPAWREWGDFLLSGAIAAGLVGGALVLIWLGTVFL